MHLYYELNTLRFVLRLMKLIASILLVMIADLSMGQYGFYSSDGWGELVNTQTNNCSQRSLGTYNYHNVFLDIAITPNGTLYGVSDSLYRIDTITGSAIPIGPIETNDGDYAAGVGLVGLNDDYLLGDDNDSLVKISVATGQAERLGYIGYWCGGDFAFFKGVLYMADGGNHLIEIQLDPNTHQVISVQDIGYMTTEYGGTYALFTTYISCNNDEKGLYAIDGDKVFLINTTNANATYSCALVDHGSLGGASIYDFDSEYEPTIIPNVFTPNGDGSNDLFELNFSYQSVIIYNRWGSKVYESKDNSHNWDGKTTAGTDVPAGTYYYIIHRDASCGENELEKGYVTLMR